MNSFSNNQQCEEMYSKLEPETIREQLEFAGFDVPPIVRHPELFDMPECLEDFDPEDVSDDYDFWLTESALLLSPLEFDGMDDLYSEDDLNEF